MFLAYFDSTLSQITSKIKVLVQYTYIFTAAKLKNTALFTRNTHQEVVLLAHFAPILFAITATHRPAIVRHFCQEY